MDAEYFCTVCGDELDGIVAGNDALSPCCEGALHPVQSLQVPTPILLTVRNHLRMMSVADPPAIFATPSIKKRLDTFSHQNDLLECIKQRISAVEFDAEPYYTQDYAIRPLRVNASALADRDRLINDVFMKDRASISTIGEELNIPETIPEIIHYFFEEGMDSVELEIPGRLKPYRDSNETIDVWGSPDGFWSKDEVTDGIVVVQNFVLELKTFYGAKCLNKDKILAQLRQMAVYQLCWPLGYRYVLVYINTNTDENLGGYTYFALEVVPDENLRCAYDNWRSWFVSFGRPGWRRHLCQIVREYNQRKAEGQAITPRAIKRQYE